jgi:hypothetical protein
MGIHISKAYIGCFFFHMSAQEEGRGIQTSDLRFIRRGSSQLSYLLGTHNRVLNCKSMQSMMYQDSSERYAKHIAVYLFFQSKVALYYFKLFCGKYNI